MRGDSSSSSPLSDLLKKCLNQESSFISLKCDFEKGMESYDNKYIKATCQEKINDRCREFKKFYSPGQFSTELKSNGFFRGDKYNLTSIMTGGSLNTIQCDPVPHRSILMILFPLTFVMIVIFIFIFKLFKSKRQASSSNVWKDRKYLKKSLFQTKD